MNPQTQQFQPIERILIKGLIRKKFVNFQIESLRTRLEGSVQSSTVNEKMIFHLAILLSECEKRNNRLLTNISLDTVYVKANDYNDHHVFIDEEEQLLKPQNQKLSAFVIFRNIFISETMIYLKKQKLQKISLIYQSKKNFQFPKKDIKALKWTQSSGEEQDKLYEYREINLMEKIVDCKHCAKLYGYSKINLESIFFLRYYDITLEQLANKFGQNQEVTQKQYIYLFTQIALALNDLHSQGIIHRDLKPENIMFEYNQQNQSFENMICVLIDFDRSILSWVKNQEEYYQGSNAFQSPEGTQVQYDASYDIWQLGFIMLCILLRKKCTKYSSTYKPIETEEEYKEIINPFFNSAQEKFSKWCPLISQMIEYQKEKRPTLKQVIQELQKMND